MSLGFFRSSLSRPDFLQPAELALVRDEIVSSPYLGATTLNERFDTTLGFSVTFTRAGLSKVEKNWPAIFRYLGQVLDPKCNAFFLNPLVISRGSHVDAHIDCSLRAWTTPEDPPFPRKVSVFYVDVPHSVVGGDLLIYRAGMARAIRPRINLLVEFLGSLRHEVSPLKESQADSPRISLVCEQYQMERDLLQLIPDFHLNTKRSFQVFLENALENSGFGNDACA